MSVQSARVQRVVKGDDAALTHQVVEKAALLANEVLAPVMIQTGDTVKCFYPRQDGINDPGNLASPIGSLPTSMISVAVPGDIPAVGNVPESGTKMWQSGLGRTVRVEITRAIGGTKETHYLIDEVDVLERGFPHSEDDPSGGVNPPQPNLILP